MDNVADFEFSFQIGRRVITLALQLLLSHKMYRDSHPSLDIPFRDKKSQNKISYSRSIFIWSDFLKQICKMYSTMSR